MKLKGDVLNRNILVEMHILVDLVPMNAATLTRMLIHLYIETNAKPLRKESPSQ